ncbi:hypothetical protein ACFSTC_36785 [Nonomuraea ferruginea]
MPGSLDPVDRLLEVPDPVLLAVCEQAEVAFPQVRGEARDAPLEVGPVGLADQQVGILGAQHGDAAGPVGERDRPFLVRQRRAGGRQQGQGERGEHRDPA